MHDAFPPASPGSSEDLSALRWWQPILSGALAGGMGWGIRGQYGHETGAMIAGLLISLVLTHLFCPQATGLPVARAIAWCTVGIGLGGSMTYGQTVGLTHDPALVGHHAALAWGLLGLAIKGSIWIGFAGVFLGMGLGGRCYRPLELLLVMTAMYGLFRLGTWLLNAPFDPANHLLPRIYFSADWRWLPDAALKPRREVWGGLLFALAGLLFYVAVRRQDVLARNLGLWAMAAGAVGFPLGQSLQAFHAWHRDVFASGAWAAWDPLINWWNLMETTFGTIAGAGVGLGLWLNRRHLPPLHEPGRGWPRPRHLRFKVPEQVQKDQAALREPGSGRARLLPSRRTPHLDPARPEPRPTGLEVTEQPCKEQGVLLEAETGRSLAGPVAWLLLAVHSALLVAVEFAGWSWVDPLYDLGLVAAIIPIVAIAGSRWWPVAVIFPITALPIAGKTLLALAYQEHALSSMAGWFLYLLLPLGLCGWAAAWWGIQGRLSVPAWRFTRFALVFATWLYFGLNFALFRFPWPWTTWTYRTPSALVFLACSAGLTVAALAGPRHDTRDGALMQ